MRRVWRGGGGGGLRGETKVRQTDRQEEGVRRAELTVSKSFVRGGGREG